MTSIQVEVLPEHIKAEALQCVNPLVGEKGGNLKVEDFNSTSCMNNCQDSMFCVDDMPQPSNIEGRGDVLEHGDNLLVNHMDADSTEYSSSVEGDFSDYEDILENDSCNVKTKSELDELPLIFNRCNRVFRKKKLTEHWRKFIQPLMWRCRWIELRIKELQSQVARYDRELLAYSKKESEEVKPPLSQHSTMEEQTVVSRGQKLYHRKKRKKIEDMVDVPSYISQHVIFSYFDNKPESGALSIDEGFNAQAEQNTTQDDIALNLEWPILEIKGNDKFLERILLDIESAQVRVLAVSSQLSKIICENADLYTPGVFIPGDRDYRPLLSPRCSPIHNGWTVPLETASTSLHPHEFENKDLVLSGSVASSYGDAGHPDIIGSTVDLLAIGNSFGHNRIGSLGTDAAEDILIHNQVAEEGLHSFENASHPLAKPWDTVKAEDECAGHMVSSSETETDPEIAPAVRRKPSLKRCAGAAEFHLRRSKRKRKMRKTSPGSWNGEKIRRRKQPRKQGPR